MESNTDADLLVSMIKLSDVVAEGMNECLYCHFNETK